MGSKQDSFLTRKKFDESFKKFNIFETGRQTLMNILNEQPCFKNFIINPTNVTYKETRNLKIYNRRQDYDNNSILRSFAPDSYLSSRFGEYVFFKDYVIDFDPGMIMDMSKEDQIEATRFLSFYLVKSFYDHLKIDILNRLEITDYESYDVEFMKLFNNSYVDDYKHLDLYSAYMNPLCDDYKKIHICIDTIKECFGELYLPYVTFLIEDDSMYQKYTPDNCFTLSPTTAYYCNKPSKTPIITQFKPDATNFFNLAKSSVRVIIGNLFNHLLIKLTNKKDNISEFILYNRWASALPQLLKNPLDIYIVKENTKDIIEKTKIDTSVLKSKLETIECNVRKSICEFIDEKFASIIFKIQDKLHADNIFRIKKQDEARASILISLSKYNIDSNGYLNLDDSNVVNINCYVDEVGFDISTKCDIRTFLSLDDEHIERLIEQRWRAIYQDDFCREMFRKYITPHLPEIRTILKDLLHTYANSTIQNLSKDKLKIETEYKEIRSDNLNNRKTMFNNIKLYGKDVDIKNKLCEIGFYTNSSKYSIGTVSCY